MAKTTTTVPQMVEGQLVHTEIMTKDAKALRTFLEKQFGWKFQTFPIPQGGEYHMFTTPGNTAGGVGEPFPGQTVQTLAYIAVKDIKATATSLEKAGAEIVTPPMEVMGQGWMLHFRYKGSPVLACWQGTAQTS